MKRTLWWQIRMALFTQILAWVVELIPNTATQTLEWMSRIPNEE